MHKNFKMRMETKEIKIKNSHTTIHDIGRVAKITVSNVSILPKLKHSQKTALFHTQSDETPLDGELIIVKYESGYMEVVRVNSDLDTDEISEWAYLNDLI